MTEYDRPFKTYDEMIELLKGRNIIVNDENAARHYLSTFSYYTIVNGYKETFQSNPGLDVFYHGTSLEDLIVLHIIDSDLGNILLKFILHIEGFLKSHISYRVSSKYGVHVNVNNPNTDITDYLHRDHYSKSNKMRNNTLRGLRDKMDPDARHPGFRSDSLKHYMKKHNHIPPWILVTSLTLGEATQWYQIMKPIDKKWICEQMYSDRVDASLQEEYLTCSLKILRSFRNAIAHGYRTYLNFGDKESPKAALLQSSSGIVLENEYKSNSISRSGLHSVIGIIWSLLPDDIMRNLFALDIITFFDRYNEYEARGKTLHEILQLPTDISDRIFNNVRKE